MTTTVIEPDTSLVKHIVETLVSGLNELLKVGPEDFSALMLNPMQVSPELYNHLKVIGSDVENGMSTLGVLNSILPKDTKGRGLIVAYVADDNHYFVEKFEMSADY